MQTKSPQGLGGGLDRPIFYGSVIIIVSLCLPLALYPQQGQQILGQAFDYLTHNFGILYLMGSVATLLFLLYLAFSRYGEIRLGSSSQTFPAVGRQCCLRRYWYQYFVLGHGGMGALLPILYAVAPGSPEALNWAVAAIFIGVLWLGFVLLTGVAVSYSYYVREANRCA